MTEGVSEKWARMPGPLDALAHKLREAFEAVDEDIEGIKEVAKSQVSDVLRGGMTKDEYAVLKLNRLTAKVHTIHSLAVDSLEAIQRAVREYDLDWDRVRGRTGISWEREALWPRPKKEEQNG